MKSIHKKGMSIGDMYPAVLTIVVVGIILGIGIFVMSQFHDTIAADRAGFQGAINVTAGQTSLTNSTLTNFNLSAVASVFNDTVTVTNYTWNQTGVVVWGADIILTNFTDLYNITFTFSYDAADSPEESATTVISGLANFADWIAIIVITIAAAIVIGIVLSSFGRKRNMI